MKNDQFYLIVFLLLLNIFATVRSGHILGDELEKMIKRLVNGRREE